MSQNRNETKLKNIKNNPMKNYTEMLVRENSYEIMNFYLHPYNKNAVLKQGKNISNPFLKENQKTPSFNIYFSKRNQTWLYNDFATGDKGNCIELVKRLFNLSFKEAIAQILNDLAELGNSFPEAIRATSDYKTFSPNNQREIPLKKMFSLKELEYWESFGISLETLNFYEVFALSEIPGSKLKSTENPFFPVFGYPYENAFKVYMPVSTKNRFFFKGEKPENFYFGFKQLPENGDYVILTGGEKDVMSLKANGFNAFCLNSETALPTDLLIKQLKERFDHIVILYDNDETGRKRSIDLAQKFSLIRIELPEREGLKDISDFFKAKYSVNEIEALINEAIKKSEPENLKVKTAPWSNISSSPLISESVYENFPNFFKDICMVHLDLRSRDVSFLSALCLISGCLPNVSGVYFQNTYMPHLFGFIIAPPASGKGNVGLIRLLGEAIHNSKKDRSNELYKQYLKDMKAYKDPKNSTVETEPQKPKFEVLFIPANSSAAGMLDQLNQNNGTGIIFDTEADSAGNAFKNDWGNYSEMLRKAFHHETISCLRKAERQFIEVPNPLLALNLAGTPSQVLSIIKTAEDGLFSRFIFYVFTSLAKWIDVSPSANSTNLNDHYKSLGRKLKDIHDHYNLNPTTFDLTTAQWEILNKHCEISLKEIDTLFDENASSIVKRMGLIWFRISMIFTCIRAYEENTWSDKLMCSLLDFNAAKELFVTFLCHSKLMYSNLPKVASQLDPIKQKFYDLIPGASFTAGQAIQLGKQIPIEERTVRKYIKIFVEKGLLTQVKYGTYCKQGMPSVPNVPEFKVA